MEELNLKRGMEDYGDGIKKLLTDIKYEIENNIRDGIGIKLASENESEVKTYNFLKNQGYDMSYKEFYEFYKESQVIVENNYDLIEKALEEQESSELNDDELEVVAGGKGWFKKNWKKVAVGAGIALLLGAAIVVTGGLAGVAAAGAAASTVGLSGAAGATFAAASATATTCGYIGAGLAAAGIGSITAATLE